MAQNQQRQSQEHEPKDMASWKPGSDAASAKDVKAEGDFGVPVGSGPSRDRDYVSENTRRSDPGVTQPRSGEDDGGDGVRTSGAGGPAVGDGSSSGGDLDPDFLGVSTGGTGVSASGPDDRPGPDDSDGSSNEFNSPVPRPHPGQTAAVVEPARGRNQDLLHQVGGSKRVQGSVVGTGDVSTGTDHQGADAATNPLARGDDSFAGEISTGEAQGQDLSMSPSQDTQGLSQDDNQARQKDFEDNG